MNTIDLTAVARDLRGRFGASLQAPYIPGKTMFRDALCEQHGLSQSAAEALCDSAERSGVIRFSAPSWMVRAGRSNHPRRSAERFAIGFMRRSLRRPSVRYRARIWKPRCSGSLRRPRARRGIRSFSSASPSI